jgi:hypothetical protein
MPRLTNENKTQIKPYLGGAKRDLLTRWTLIFGQNSSNRHTALGAKVQILGCRDVYEEDEAGGTKTRSPQSQASSNPLFEQEGSAICDRFYEVLFKRRVSPCQDSTVLNVILHSHYEGHALALLQHSCLRQIIKLQP